jgi:hypothetical protein
LTRFAKAAGAGELLNIHDLKVAYEKAIGHECRFRPIADSHSGALRTAIR